MGIKFGNHRIEIMTSRNRCMPGHTYIQIYTPISAYEEAKKSPKNTIYYSKLS